jgi:uncharacterized protein (DUF362 family)/ferredoxin
MKVLIKPNLLLTETPDKAITTHPAVIDALCKIISKEKADIWIGDSSGVQSDNRLHTDRLFDITGMKKIAEKYKARIVPFEMAGSGKVVNKKAALLKEFRVVKPVLKADYVIDVPKLKTHALVKYTGAVKNMFGCIPGGGKGRSHFIAPQEDKFCNLLLDIYEAIKPDFVLMDAIIGLEGDGPGSAGIPKKTGLILASKNGIALDFVASEIIGYHPLEILTNKFSMKRKMFDGKIEVVGEKKIRIPYKKPLILPFVKFGFLVKWFSKQALATPGVDKKKCKRCSVCKKVCPVNAIELNPYPVWDRKTCILCYCCHELCPYNAIILNKQKIINILEKTYQLAMRKLR